jgi:hypothetical protein
MMCLVAGRAVAQEQERKLMDRLTRPNVNLAYDTTQSTFGRPAAFGKVKGAKTKDFGGSKAFSSREYVAKAYGDREKRSWISSLFFSTKNANTKGKYEIPNAAEKYDAKTAPTKDAREAAKSMDTTAYAATDLQYLKRSRFDTSLKEAPPQGGKTPLGYTGSLQPMTIDDVRELLNKNK